MSKKYDITNLKKSKDLHTQTVETYVESFNN